ncbi:hypothetical protein D8770_26795 [Methylobacterium sp. DB1607]|nr:hypothetical protein [Methylobacterium sp. DB1607]
MKLFKIEARFADDGCIENRDLYVRAKDDTEAFTLWVNCYDLNDAGSYSEAMAEDEHDVGFEIIELKTYAEPAPAEGSISWDDYERIIVEAL